MKERAAFQPFRPGGATHNKREGSQLPPPPPSSVRVGGGSLDKAVAMETEDQVGYQRGLPTG